MKQYLQSNARWGGSLICLLCVTGCEPDQFVSMGSDGGGATAVSQEGAGGVTAIGGTAGPSSDQADAGSGCGVCNGALCATVGGYGAAHAGAASAGSGNAPGGASGIAIELPRQIAELER